VYNFLAGQYNTFTTQSFQTAVAQYYPLSDYGGSFSLQGQQMYGKIPPFFVNIHFKKLMSHLR
jgi:hypothetical protein